MMLVSKSHILSEIRRTAEANGGVPLGSQRFATETGIRASDWKGKHWARWGDAVREAGLFPNKRTQAYKEEELLDSYAKLAMDLGRLPVDADIRLACRNGFQIPTPGSFTTRFGDKAQLIESLLDYCQDRPEYSDVAAWCKDYAPRTRPSEDSETATPELGFVYLGKSGRFYKIGKSNATGRREYELRIQLPEKIRFVHQIRTDDPVGIEAYWHKRFAAKHKNGEWFELKAEDVQAFKRRKFM